MSKKIKVVAFNGSPKKNGNTSIIIGEVFQELEKHGIETELIKLKGKKMNGCIGCNKCREKKGRICVAGNKFIDECIEKMIEADGIILGSPVYFADVTTEMKALIDVAGYVTRSEELLKHKVGASVAVARRAGGMPTFTTMNNFFLINQMVIPGNSYWNLAMGKAPGDVKKDEEGMQVMRNLGQNMAWLLKKLKGCE